jgi:hypothetical protein
VLLGLLPHLEETSVIHPQILCLEVRFNHKSNYIKVNNNLARGWVGASVKLNQAHPGSDSLKISLEYSDKWAWEVGPQVLEDLELEE